MIYSIIVYSSMNFMHRLINSASPNSVIMDTAKIETFVVKRTQNLM